jgi:hypothetical protein
MFWHLSTSCTSRHQHRQSSWREQICEVVLCFLFVLLAFSFPFSAFSNSSTVHTSTGKRDSPFYICICINIVLVSWSFFFGCWGLGSVQLCDSIDIAKCGSFWYGSLGTIFEAWINLPGREAVTVDRGCGVGAEGHRLPVFLVPISRRLVRQREPGTVGDL